MSIWLSLFMGVLHWIHRPMSEQYTIFNELLADSSCQHWQQLKIYFKNQSSDHDNSNTANGNSQYKPKQNLLTWCFMWTVFIYSCTAVASCILFHYLYQFKNRLAKQCYNAHNIPSCRLLQPCHVCVVYIYAESRSSWRRVPLDC